MTISAISFFLFFAVGLICRDSAPNVVKDGANLDLKKNVVIQIKEYFYFKSKDGKLEVWTSFRDEKKLELGHTVVIVRSGDPETITVVTAEAATLLVSPRGNCALFFQRAKGHAKGSMFERIEYMIELRN